MRSPTPKRHDEFFKEAFSYPEVARDFLRYFLPEPIQEKLDFSQLEPVKDAFVSGSLNEFFADVIYRCPFAGSNHEAWVTILWEHKSSPVPYPHFQLLKYMVGIWEGPLKRKNKPPLILPVIVYNGQEEWPKQTLVDYFPEADESLVKYLPDFEYILTDLKKIPDEFIIGLKAGILINTLLSLKHIWDEQYLINKIGIILTGLDGSAEEDERRNFVRSILVYIFGSMEMNAGKAELIIENFPKSVNKIAMSTLEQLVEKRVEAKVQMLLQQGLQEGLQQGLQEGLQQGLQEGLQQGLQEGLQQGIRQVLEAGLREGLSINLLSKLTRLPEEKVVEILDQIKKEKA